MYQVVNTHQAQAWNGYEGQHWAGNEARYDAVNSGFNEQLLTAAAIGTRDRVLDIGCGNGQFTRLAARHAALGGATGIDLSEPMLATARAAAAAGGVPNVTFEHGDAQVHQFPSAAFDVAVSRFGIMFFADPVAAFTNITAALRPGGRLAMLSLMEMSRNDLGPVIAALSAHLPRPATVVSDEPGPASFADPDVVRGVLRAAGLVEVTTVGIEAAQLWGTDARDAAGFLSDWGPFRDRLAALSESDRGQARAAVTDALRPYETGTGVWLRGAAWLITAARPAS